MHTVRTDPQFRALRYNALDYYYYYCYNYYDDDDDDDDYCTSVNEYVFLIIIANCLQVNHIV